MADGLSATLLSGGLVESLSGLLETDLSVQVLNSLFGEGWQSPATLAEGGGTALMGSLLFDLFGVLNCCCALAVAWLFILTTLAATLGAAQDGHGIAGRRYSNAWIPLRYSFAMGAVTPVFAGLNAMQMLMLTAIAASVQFADAMWAEGLEHISTAGAVQARSMPVTAASAGRVLPVLYEHHVLKRYFEEQEMCAFAPAADVERAGWSMNRYVVRSELPRLLNCPNLRGDDGYGMTLNPALHFGDFGGVRVSTPVRAASEALAEALAADGALYRAAGESAARALAAEGSQVYAAADVGGLARLYQSTVAQALREGVSRAVTLKEGALSSFAEQAGKQGWWLAGSYYWTLARLAADTVEAMQDRTEVLPVRTEALSDFMNPDLERSLALARELGARAAVIAATGLAGNPVTSELDISGYEEAALEEEGGLAGTLSGFFAGASQAVAEFALDETRVGEGLVSVIAGHDLVFNVVRASRVLMNVCENVVAGYVALKLAGRGLGALVKNPAVRGLAGLA
ncbi:MAG: hypothetical protein Q4F72_08650, partial [Desulfovibrionaceae bacterium]|nr:hypothetical protein [Desulfovibrionaceae bacterium]